MFHSAIDKWKDKPTTQDTIANFQAHFKEENDWHIEMITSTQVRFQHANTTIMTDVNDLATYSTTVPQATFSTITIANKPPMPTEEPLSSIVGHMALASMPVT